MTPLKELAKHPKMPLAVLYTTGEEERERMVDATKTAT